MKTGRWLIFLILPELCYAALPQRPLAESGTRAATVLYAGNIKACRFSSSGKNLCQEKGAGGHSGTIFSTQEGFCAKKIRSKHNLKEIEFYQSIHRECSAKNGEAFGGLCRFFPEFHGLCQHKKKIYVQMQNLRLHPESRRKMTDPLILDLKPGRKTSSMISMKHSGAGLPSRTFWSLVHVVLDHVLSSSASRGYRFAGLSPAHEQNSLPSPFRNARLFRHPEDALKQFAASFAGQPFPRRCLDEKLSELIRVTADSSFQRFHLMGASLLMIYDRAPRHAEESGCSVHLIDFANSFILNQNEQNKDYKKNLKYTKDFRKSLRNIRQDLLRFM